jgi:CDP-glucose 4,6-dehydratase
MVENNFISKYTGKRVFITGHTGFKGTWLTYALQKAGAIIKGYALAPDTEPSLFSLIENTITLNSVIADINDASSLEQELLSFEPDFIFHLAAQPLVRKSYQEPLNTFSTNVIGTANVLNALLKLNKPCTTVLITTDKVYENKEWHYPYRETDRLGGYDPYSASKACAELIINSYYQSFFNPSKLSIHQKGIVSVRAGNVIGGGDWSLDRLLPDIARYINEGKDIVIRNPNAVRPWQHVLEPVFGYLQLGVLLQKKPLKYGGAWNFGPANADNLPVLQIAEQAIGIWGKGNIDLQVDPNALHEAGLLKLDISKATNEMKWQPRMNTTMAIERTIQWYKSFYEGAATAADLLEADITYYQSLLQN